MIRALAIAAALAAVQLSAAAQDANVKKIPAPQKRAAVAEKPLPQADQAQLDAAERTHFGNYVCDFKQTIDVSMNPKNPGYVDVKFEKKTWTMKPSLSSTGALRLEDVKGQTLLLQIANKSMLMDTKAGKRLVDDCAHEKQRAIREELAKKQ
jgi:hypothetical protein